MINVATSARNRPCTTGRAADPPPSAEEPAHQSARHKYVRAARITITVAALAALAGCGSTVNGAHPGTQGKEASVTMGGPPQAPARPAPDGEVTVTEADSGKTVHLHIGQRLRVVLGGRGERWHRPASPGPPLRLATASGGYPSARPASAVFLAVLAGTTSVTSMTDHPCLHAQPPCMIAQRAWSVRVLVTDTA